MPVYSPTGKHFQLIVPNYDQSGSNAHGAPLSYIRLGQSFDDDDPNEPLKSKQLRGDHLLENLAFKDDWRQPNYPDKPYVRDDKSTAPDVSSATESGNITRRKELTAELLSRGGWREHTDGNHISTTRGDHVEVIGGNYKLIVLGRTAQDWDPEGLGDAGNSNNVGRTRQEVSSGGHYNESTSTPGEVMSITWATEEDGTWKTIEQTDHGDVKSIFNGWIKEEYFGPSIISTIGCGVGAESIEAAKGGASNVSTAGAHPATKPVIKEATFARSIQAKEHYDSVSDKTFAGAVMESTHVNVLSMSKETAAKTTSLAFHVLFNETLLATTINNKDGFTGWRRNYTVGAATLGIGIIGATVTKTRGIGIGLALEASNISIAVSASVSCMMFLDTKLRVGNVVEIGVPAWLEVKPINLNVLGKRIKAGLQTAAAVAVIVYMCAKYSGNYGLGMWN